MDANTGARIIRQAINSPVHTWLDYVPTDTPMAIYDDETFIFINHPNPPSERPNELMAATAIEINGVLTATIPAALCEDEQELMSTTYHECFHVYQGTAFKFEQSYLFFEILAFYPELDANYRAFCSAETAVLNNHNLQPLEQAKYLATLSLKRHQILSAHHGLLEFEKDLERNEGVASFVGQMVCKQLYGLSPDDLVCRYSYSRQYFVGAAICWLLDGLYPSHEWQNSIEAGTSLSEFLIRAALDEAVNLEDLHLSSKQEQEQIAAQTARAKAEQQIESLLRSETLTIKLPDETQVSRSFMPSNIVSLGDGRIIHPESVIIQVPNGEIAVHDQIVLENYVEGTITFPAIPYQVTDQALAASEDGIEISLDKVRQVSDSVIELL